MKKSKLREERFSIPTMPYSYSNLTSLVLNPLINLTFISFKQVIFVLDASSNSQIALLLPKLLSMENHRPKRNKH